MAVKHPSMLFPQDSATAAKWFSIVQHRAQAQYYKENDLDVLLLGRRRADGNYCGKGSNTIPTKKASQDTVPWLRGAMRKYWRISIIINCPYRLYTSGKMDTYAVRTRGQPDNGPDSWKMDGVKCLTLMRIL